MRRGQDRGRAGARPGEKLRWGCSRQTGADRPCTCAMGNVSRFIEPVVLRILKEKQRSYGYEIAECLCEYALTDATIEGAALYRTLRTLEANGHVRSKWEAGAGPARRSYALTPRGEEHLQDWNRLMKELGTAMIRFAQRGEGHAPAAVTESAN
jgi:DNA-binding PadR family transcriptional regulator